MNLPRPKTLPLLEEEPRELARAALEHPGPFAPAVTREALTRDQRRSRRKREVRGKTVSVRRMTKQELELGRVLFPPDPDAPARPRTRAECAEGARPCPFVSCVHHLYLEVSRKTGSIKLNFPDLEPDELRDSCALDIADRGGETLEAIGGLLNLTRERVRQIETAAAAKVRAVPNRAALEELLTDGGDGPSRRRRLPLAPEPREFDVEGFLALDDADSGPQEAA